MFRRRKKRNIAERLREALWPSMGLRRVLFYFWYRILRLKGTPESVAAGLACGVAVSFTPFIGLHFLLALALAFVLRANLAAAMIGTIVGNPWTFPLIWSILLQTGRLILGQVGDGVAMPERLSVGEFFRQSAGYFSLIVTDWSEFFRITLTGIMDIPKRPMVVGAFPWMLFSWILCYFGWLRLLRLRRLRRKKRLEAVRAARVPPARIAR